jgi:hypothetical protein
MAVFTIPALIIGSVLAYFTIGALASLANIVAVLGGIVVAAGITYSLIEESLLPFDSELAEAFSALVIGAGVGAISFKFFQAFFAVAGWGIALILVVLAVAFFVRPFLTFNILSALIGGVLESLGGE